MLMARSYSPVFSKGHIRDEAKILIDDFVRRYYPRVPNADLYMDIITYKELCDEMGCCMYDPKTNDHGRIYGYNIKIDNTIPAHVFMLKRRRKDMSTEDMDAFRYVIEDRDSVKHIKHLFKPSVLPKKYIVNQDACILFWNDGDKTIVKRSKDDKDDPVKGFLWAYFQYTCGMSKTKANKYLRELDEAVKEAK